MMGLNAGIVVAAALAALFHFQSSGARNIRALPDDPRLVCPIHEELNEFNSTLSLSNNTRLIDLGKVVGKKLKVQFYTPNPVKAIAKHLEETTLGAYFIEDTSIATEIFPITLADEGETTEAEVTTTLATTVGTNEDLDPPDILCQWEFLAANVSEYILLTFHDMSAPYSDDCSDAYVSLQKDNGYESRWCGNRRQTLAFGLPNFALVNWRYGRSPVGRNAGNKDDDANARPMSLVSKTKAKITVFRKGKAPSFPPTGFTLTVESFDVFASGGVDNSLRVLLG